MLAAAGGYILALYMPALLFPRPPCVTIFACAGAIGSAEWSGVKLRDVLRYAGFDEDNSDDVAHVQFEGLDSDASGTCYGSSIPIDKAMGSHGDVLLAFAMNGRCSTQLCRHCLSHACNQSWHAGNDALLECNSLVVGRVILNSPIVDACSDVTHADKYGRAMPCRSEIRHADHADHADCVLFSLDPGTLGAHAAITCHTPCTPCIITPCVHKYSKLQILRAPKRKANPWFGQKVRQNEQQRLDVATMLHHG